MEVHEPSARPSPRSELRISGRVPRLVSLALLAAVVLVGLGGRVILPPAVGGPLGDTLYATMVVVLVVLVIPGMAPWLAALLGWGVSAGVELLQLTGASGAIVVHFPAARYVLGTTFAATDLAWYALGAVLGGCVIAWVRATRARRAT
ncbi:MAG: DUF2809 domain-containing protein [Cellulomonadaceae bacterium]|nr:DUF2809 domain-containing protein [Cellulomonadaceae bacterium]